MACFWLKLVQMRYLVSVLILVLFCACIPLSVAPSIETYKVKIAKRFKNDLPKSYGYIFNDPKDANEFFDYVNTKFQLAGLEQNIPVWIDDKPYVLDFYERRRTKASLNLIPIVADAALSSKTDLTFFDRFYNTRTERWYIIITVTTLTGQDCLSPQYINSKSIVEYLKSLQEEYLSTTNYMEAYFRRK